MILEGIVTTRSPSGETNIAPMGPIVDSGMERLLLRPFQSSTTFRNLKETRAGVFHVVDDVLLLTRAALDEWEAAPELFPAERIEGEVLRGACRWYEFEVESLDESEERARIEARVVHAGRLRDFFGFNRAKHAVLEAAILATRVFLISREELEAQLAPLRSAVEKTAGPDEAEAFRLIEEHIRRYFAAQGSGGAAAD